MYFNLAKLSRDEIVELKPGDIGASTLKLEEILRIFSAQNLFYMYDYASSHNRKKKLSPHVILPTGRHTDFYIQQEALLRNSALAEILGTQLLKKLKLGREISKLSPRERREQPPVWVVGPDYGSAFLVSAMARELQAWQAVTKKIEGKDQEWSLPPITANSFVQIVDDIISSAASLVATRSAIVEALPVGTKINIQSEAGVVINMSGVNKIGELEIVSLLKIEPQIWYKSDCPLCRQGSQPLSMESNWPELTAACWREPPTESGKYSMLG